ncbi:MAG: polyprenyl synthetase family protein [Atopostipes suicloacalis]|nr:polyprenyl synthetase family protein [Atopostipes suicloacalis]MDN6730916.1 polyprenyl synthetase family protein [Atopostipes suicloacalis]
MKFKEFSQKQKKEFENHLLSYIHKESNTQLEEAMIYSLDARGKRLRPLLLLAVLESFNLDSQSAYPAASALEMVHTYSLIHDDLPAMDNDEMRRGKKTNHIKFNEATAILAGDALLTLAFEVITMGDLSAEIKVRLSRLLAKSSGYQGMVGGQQADIEGEKEKLSLTEIESIHSRKTGELIKMAVISGGIIGNKNEAIVEKLADFAKELGIAYQIRDDLLDCVGTAKELGKAVLTDSALGKSTYPSILGSSEAFKALDQRLEKAREALRMIDKLDSNFEDSLLQSFINQLSLEEYE